jgi:type II secretory pathway pseudopilin PulG
MTYRNKTSGFTLIELSLSMSFVAVLLLAIAMLVIQITAIYNKGFTLREVDETGQFITSELQRKLNQTGRESVVYVQDFDGGKGGRLCAGNTVYAWNYPATISPNDPQAENYRGSSDIRFMKFSGTKQDYCEPDDNGNYGQIPAEAVELLSGGNSNLMLTKFTIDAYTPDGDASQSIYQITMAIGTAGTSDSGLISGNNCDKTGDMSDEYCAINQFVFSARSGNIEVRGGDGA